MRGLGFGVRSRIQSTIEGLEMLRLGSLPRTALVCVVLYAFIDACTSQREPAQRMMQDIEATLGAVSEEAAKYVPAELAGVQTKVDDLKSAYDAHDYKAVLDRGPELLGEAHALSADAVAQRAELAKSQTEQWTPLAATVPALFAAVHARLDLLSQTKNRKMASGIDLEAAKSALRDATAQWSKAQGAFGNGNMNEAVPTAKDVLSRLQALAGTLQVELPTGLASTPAS
jgi:hypothetical protein